MPRLRAALLALMATLLPAAEPLVLAAGYDPEVRAFALTADGTLSPLASSRIGPNPSFVVTSADARFAYACNEVPAGTVTACRLDRASGVLTVLGSAASGGKGPCHVALHPDGHWLFAANYGDGTVAVLPVRSDGGVDAPVCTVRAGTQAHMALPSADGRLLYVPCKGSDRIEVYRFDAASGALAPAASATTATGAGPRHLALAADGRPGWLVNELASTVQTVTARDDGSLLLGQPVSTLPAGWTGGSTAGGILTVAGDRLLLVSNRGNDSVALFRPGDDGRLVPAGHAPVGGTPRHLASSPDGRWLLVACQDAGRVEVHRLDPAGPALQLTGSATAPRPAWVGVLP